MTGVGNEGGAVSSQSRMRSVLIYFHVAVNIQFASANKNPKICNFFHSSTAAVFGCGVFGYLLFVFAHAWRHASLAPSRLLQIYGQTQTPINAQTVEEGDYPSL